MSVVDYYPVSDLYYTQYQYYDLYNLHNPSPNSARNQEGNVTFKLPGQEHTSQGRGAYRIDVCHSIYENLIQYPPRY